MDICATDSASLSNPISLLCSAHTWMAFPRISSPPSSLLEEEEAGMDCGDVMMLTNVLRWVGDVKNKLLFRPQGFMYSRICFVRAAGAIYYAAGL